MRLVDRAEARGEVGDAVDLAVGRAVEEAGELGPALDVGEERRELLDVGLVVAELALDLRPDLDRVGRARELLGVDAGDPREVREALVVGDAGLRAALQRLDQRLPLGAELEEIDDRVEGLAVLVAVDLEALTPGPEGAVGVAELLGDVAGLAEERRPQDRVGLDLGEALEDAEALLTTLSPREQLVEVVADVVEGLLAERLLAEDPRVELDRPAVVAEEVAAAVGG